MTSLEKNTYTSIAYQIITIICGFIIPRLLLGSFGSETYGLVCSISSFLSVISYLDMGMTAVVQSALYKPLADRNSEGVSLIISSADRFFKLLAIILVIYVAVLVFVYPHISESSFGFFFIGSLVVIMSISLFAQYYFGITNQLLLCADQKLYIPNLLQIITLIVNTAVCAFFIFLKLPVQLVYLATALIYLSRPVYYSIYVKKHYSITKIKKIEGEPIKQKWNGLAQHIATVVLDGTGTIVLTIFSSLTNVAIYGVYYLVVSGLNKLFVSSTAGFQSYYGELWAKNDVSTLTKSFSFLLWGIHTAVVFVFGCASVLIVPFVKVYTLSITDVNYDVPLFALIFTLAYACYCLRLPFNILVLACNHYKQTQRSYIIATVLNIVVSVVAVNLIGLIGVALGTLTAMTFQTLWMANYTSENLIKWPIRLFCRQLIVDLLVIALSYVMCLCFSFDNPTLLSWILMAIKTAIVWISFSLIVNWFLYRPYMKQLLSKIKSI